MAERVCVLDASAFLAYLQKEKGYEKVREYLRKGKCIINTVNMGEVYAKIIQKGINLEEIREYISLLPNLEILCFSEEEALISAKIYKDSKESNIFLSLGDRACISTGLKYNLPVLTADREWKKIKFKLKRLNLEFVR